MRTLQPTRLLDHLICIAVLAVLLLKSVSYINWALQNYQNKLSITIPVQNMNAFSRLGNKFASNTSEVSPASESSCKKRGFNEKFSVLCRVSKCLDRCMGTVNVIMAWTRYMCSKDWCVCVCALLQRRRHVQRYDEYAHASKNLKIVTLSLLYCLLCAIHGCTCLSRCVLFDAVVLSSR